MAAIMVGRRPPVGCNRRRALERVRAPGKWLNRVLTFAIRIFTAEGLFPR